MPDPVFTETQARAAQHALRSSFDLGEETFPLRELIGMLSDEIEQMRTAGHSDQHISEIVHKATGQPVPPDAIARFYATPEQRNHGG